MTIALFVLSVVEAVFSIGSDYCDINEYMKNKEQTKPVNIENKINGKREDKTLINRGGLVWTIM